MLSGVDHHVDIAEVVAQSLLFIQIDQPGAIFSHSVDLDAQNLVSL